jgi:hypothetical protein
VTAKPSSKGVATPTARSVRAKRTDEGKAPAKPLRSAKKAADPTAATAPVSGAPTPTVSVSEAAVLTPLDIMLRAMREHFAAGRLEAAVAIAKEAAPYVHGKLGSSAPSAGASLVRLEWLEPPNE